MGKVDIFPLDSKEAITINNFQRVHADKLKELDKKLEFYRDLIKKELYKACSTSYAEYKAAKKITLDDNNTIGQKNPNNEEKVDITEKKKKKLDEESASQNFLKYSMPYAQDATRRTHYKKLLRFIRAIDFLYNEAKYNLIFESLQNLALKFERIYDNYLSNNIDVPLLVSYCHPQKNSIFFLPTPEDIKKSIFEQFLTEKIYTVIYRRSFIDPQEFPNYMSCFDEVFETTVDQNSNLNMRVKEDKNIMGLFGKIRKIVDLSFKALEEYTKKLLPVKQNYNSFSSVNFDELGEKTKPDELKDLLEKFIAEEKTVKAIKEKKMIGIFEYNLTNLIEVVKESPTKWIQLMKEIIPKVLMLKLKELIALLNGYLKVRFSN